MLRQVNHRAMAIAGYAEPWSGPAGMRRLSLSTDREITAVGIRRLDRDGMPVEAWPVTTLAPSQHRTLPQGAWLEVDDLWPLGRIESIAFEFMATRNEGSRTLLDTGHEVGCAAIVRCIARECGSLLAGPNVDDMTTDNIIDM